MRAVKITPGNDPEEYEILTSYHEGSYRITTDPKNSKVFLSVAADEERIVLHLSNLDAYALGQLLIYKSQEATP